MIESKLDPGRGPVVTILIGRGTLEVGDALVAGAHWGRVRAMHDFLGNRVGQALPGEPVEVLGFDGVPEAGEHVRVVENERRARQLAAERATRLKTESLARRAGKKVSLEDIFKSGVQELNLVLKADVAGSLEAIEDEIAKLPQDEVSVNVIRGAVGGVTESDVMLAAASDAVILAFNVRPVGDARAVAEREGVEIRHYSVIYRAIEELRDAMQGMLAPEEVEETLGTAEVRQIFRASRVGHDRRLATSPTARSPAARRSAWSATARSSTTARSRACAASTTTSARSPPASTAASCCGTSPTSRRATCSRRTPRGRSSASSPRAGAVADVGERLRRRARDRPALPRRREPQGQAQGAVLDQGPAPRPARAPRWPRSTTRTCGSGPRLTAALTGGSLAGAAAAADSVERWLEARCAATASRVAADRRLGRGALPSER